MHADLERLETELSRELDGLDATQTQLCPTATPGKWNIQQIAEHLLMSYQRTCEVLDERLQKGRPDEDAADSSAAGGAVRTVIRLGRFPAGRKAPPAVMPGAPATPLTATTCAARSMTASRKWTTRLQRRRSFSARDDAPPTSSWGRFPSRNGHAFTWSTGATTFPRSGRFAGIIPCKSYVNRPLPSRLQPGCTVACSVVAPLPWRARAGGTSRRRGGRFGEHSSCARPRRRCHQGGCV